MSHRCAREIFIRLASATCEISSAVRIDSIIRPNVSGPPRSSSRKRLAALFFLILMFRHLLDLHELDPLVFQHPVDRAVALAQPNRSLPRPITMQRLVVVARNPPNFFQAALFHGINPNLQLVNDVAGTAPELVPRA